MKWTHQGTERNSTRMEGVTVEILIESQEVQLEKPPLPPHSDAPLPHADSHVLDPPPAVIPRSFYPCFDHRVVVSRSKKLSRSRQNTKTKSLPPTAWHTTSPSNSSSIMLSPTSSPPYLQRKQSVSDQASEPSSAKSKSGDESPSSEIEDNSHTGDELKDKGNEDLRGSTNAAAASPNADS